MIKDVAPLLKECEETLKELKRMGNMEVTCYVQGFINSINKLPDADQRPQWIPCSERLPEEGKSVLVWYEYYAYGNKNRMVQTYGVGRVYGDFWAGDVQGTRSKCIAWMPLPAPYQEEGENNG